MNKKQLKAIAEFMAGDKDKRDVLQGIFINFEEGTAVATDGQVLVEAQLRELKRPGLGSVIVPSASVKAALKAPCKGELEITPSKIGPVEYTPMGKTYPEYRFAIPANEAPGVLPWCKPKNLMKVANLKEAFGMPYSVRLPESLIKAVRFDFRNGLEVPIVAVVAPRRDVLSNHKEYCATGKQKA